MVARICSIILLVSCSLFSKAEGTALKVNLTIENGTVGQLLQGVEAQLPYSFSYNSELIDSDSALSFTCVNMPIKKVINQVFHNRISVKIVSNYMVLIANPKYFKKKERLITYLGLVLNSENKKPIAQVSIYDIASRQTVLTNSAGEFVINVNGSNQNFSIARVNFHDTIIHTDAKYKEPKVIYLKPKETRIAVSTTPIKKVSIKEESKFINTAVRSEAITTAKNLGYIEEKRIAQVSAVPRVGSNMWSSAIIENNLSLNILGGYNGGVNGLEIGGLFNILSKNMKGVQIGGLSNFVGGYANGLQVGGLTNLVADTFRGCQIAGITNMVRESFNGLQLSGVYSHTNARLRGMQVGGIANWSKDTLNGMQLAGIVNISNGSTRGFQLAGINNQTHQTLNGMQLGFVNYAKQNNGFQLGFVNVADSAKGIAIGFFNYVKNGYHPIEIFGNEVLHTGIGFKSGVDHFYTSYFVGMQPTNPELFGFGMGFGARLNTWKWLSFSFDLTSSYINEKELKEGYTFELNLLNRFDLTMDLNWKKFTVFGGPGINLHVTQLGQNDFGIYTSTIAQSPFYEEEFDGTLLQSWIGWKFGARYNF